MEWKKSRIVLIVWQANDYRITENPEAATDHRFRLDQFSEDFEFEFYGTLKQAQAAASLRNELNLLRSDNARLRTELDTRNGVWPDRDQPGLIGRAVEENKTHEWPNADADDGRGIPF